MSEFLRELFTQWRSAWLLWRIEQPQQFEMLFAVCGGFAIFIFILYLTSWMSYLNPHEGGDDSEES